MEPEAVKEIRSVKKDGETQLEVLIKWKGLSEFESTWEDAQMINLRFSGFHLEDKVRFLGGSIAMHSPNHPILQTYTRRGKRQLALNNNKGAETAEGTTV